MVTNRSKTGLSRKIVAYYLCFCLIAVCWVAAALLATSHALLRNRTTHSCLSRLGRASAAIETHWLRHGEQGLDVVIGELSNDCRAVYWTIVGVDGTHLAHTQTVLQGKVAIEHPGARTDIGDVIGVRYVTLGGAVMQEYRIGLATQKGAIGDLRVGIEEPTFTATILAAAPYIPVAVLAPLALVGVGAMILSRFTRPVTAVESRLREIARQPLGESVEVEPLRAAAAAMHYHAGSGERHDAVVVDIGGGTTDIAHASVGGDGAPDVHRAWGIARGGTDIDLALSLASYMPLFGRGVTRVPAHHYVEAAMVQDTTRQRDFRQHRYDEVPRPYDTRLQALQDTGNTARLYRAVERSKIRLSDSAQHDEALDYIEAGLQVRIRADELAHAARSYLDALGELLAQVRSDIGRDPAAVFLTGGMSRAGYIQQVIAAAFPQARLVHGDPSFGVVQGLALAAAQR